MPNHPRDLFNEFARDDFKVFLRLVFHTLHPNEKFVDNWHIDAMCHHLMQVWRGEISNFLLTIPPSHLKSITCSIAFPAFVLGHDPSKKFVVASYGGDLASKLSRDRAHHDASAPASHRRRA